MAGAVDRNVAETGTNERLGASNSGCQSETASRLKGSVSDLQLNPGERWYVVQTLPHREAVAAQHLCAQGFRSFLPRFRKTVRHARKLRHVLAPVFPGYMFVVLDVQRDRWRSVNGTFGVARLVTAIDRPEPVPVGIVEALQSSSDLVGLVRFDSELVAGQKVRVLSGPFAQAIGALERLDDNGRVRVLLDMMGGKIPAVIDRMALTAA